MSYVSRDDALSNPLRALVRRFIEHHPGVRLTELATCLELENSTLLWHLRKLEQAGMVGSTMARPGQAYYSHKGGTKTRHLAQAVAAINTDRRQRALDALLQSPGTTVADVAARADLDTSQARFALSGLAKAGLVERIPQTGGDLYRPMGAACEASQIAKRIQYALAQEAQSIASDPPGPA